MIWFGHQSVRSFPPLQQSPRNYQEITTESITILGVGAANEAISSNSIENAWGLTVNDPYFLQYGKGEEVISVQYSSL